MFGLGRRDSKLAQDADKQLVDLAKDCEFLELVVHARDGSTNNIRYDFGHKGEYTRTVYEVSNENAVKFAYMFFFTSVLKAIKKE